MKGELIIKDLVNCNNCGTKEIKVVCGEDICPVCNYEGGLAWSFPDNPDKWEIKD